MVRPLVQHGLLNQSSAQVIDGSLKFENGSSTYLTRTPGSAGNRSNYTGSVWVKRTEFAPEDNSNSNAYNYSIFTAGTNSANNSDQIKFYKNVTGYQNCIEYSSYPGSYQYLLYTDARYRDPDAWYNVVWNYNGAVARLFVNGEIVTSFVTETQSGGSGGHFNNNVEHVIGHTPDQNNSSQFDGYMSQFNWIDGLALGPGYFGFTDPLTGVWRPKKFRAEGTTVNDGRVFSSTGTFTNWDDDGSYPKTELFDGTLYTGGTPNGASPDDGNPASFDFGDRRITGFQNLQINIFISSNQVSATNLASVNGIDITDEIHAAGNNTWTTVDLGNKFTTLQSFTIKNNNCYVGGFIIDGVVMQDSTTQNLAYGTNGFYLPMDGNSPIGEDKSGNNNDFTPVNFGGSTSLEKATGALPILNTVNGGNAATVGVRTASEGFPGAEVNDGTVWSSDMDGTLSFSDVAHNGFDGDLSNTQTRASGIVTFTFPKDVPFSSTVNLTASLDNGGGQIYIKDGTDSFVNVSDEDGGFPTGSGVETKNITSALTSPIKAIKLDGGGGSAYARMTGIEVDGEVLIDGHGLVLAVPFIGNTDDVSHLVNSSQSQKADTNSGSTASIESNFYGGSRDFDGSNDTCSFASVGACGSGDWTVEFWLYSEESGTDTVYRRIVSTGTNATSAIQIGHIGSDAASGGYITYTHSDNSVYAVNTSNVLNRWAHIAVVRESGSVNVYTDGVKGTTADSDSNNKTGTTWYVSGYGGSTSQGRFNGKIQDFRVYSGLAKYTENFIPASTNPDILPDTPSGVSGGSKLAKVIDGAVAFDTDDYLSLADSDDFNLVSSGTGDFTIEFYVYLPDQSARYVLSSGTDSTRCYINGTSRLHLNNPTDSFLMESSTAAAAITANKWTHIAFCKSSSTGYIFVDGIQYSFHSGPALGGDLDFNDLRIGRTSNSLNGFISNLRVIKGTALYTSNFTPPTEPLTNVTNTKLLCCQSNTQAGAAAASPNLGGINDGTIWTEMTSTSGNYSQYQSQSPSNLFDGDTGDGWQFSGTTASAIFTPTGGISYSSQVRVYIGATGNIANTQYKINSGSYQSFASSGAQWLTILSGSGTFTRFELYQNGDPYTMAMNAIEVDGVILKDPVSVNGDAAATNFNPFNTNINTVRGQETGYATLNPLDNTGITKLVNGNLDFRRSVNDGRINSTISASSGKWYAECQVGNDTLVGVSEVSSPTTTYPGGNAGSYGYFSGGFFYDAGSGAAYAAAFTTDDYIGCILDLDNGTIAYTKNGVSQGVAKTGLPAGSYRFSSRGGRHDGTETLDRWNFGQKPFKFSPPEGFQPLNAANVRPETVIANPTQYVGISTWTVPSGNADTHVITPFKPDLVIAKNRSNTSGGSIYNSVSGDSKFQRILSTSDEMNDAEATAATRFNFNYNGFTFEADNDNANYIAGTNSVAWYWRAGGGKPGGGGFFKDDIEYASAAAAGLSGGSLTITASSVGTKQGFSIIQYTGNSSGGATVSHGLSQTPDFFFIACRNITNGNYFDTWHSGYYVAGGSGKNYMRLTTTGAAAYASDMFQTPTSSVVTLGTSSSMNSSSGNYTLYCWHDVPGLQKFGSYSGSGSDNGTFVECGFKPALVIVKCDSTTGQEWIVYDSERGPINVINKYLELHSNLAEQTGRQVDFLSNGFKFRNGTSGATDAGSRTYIYCAWAEAPSVNLYGGQSNAR